MVLTTSSGSIDSSDDEYIIIRERQRRIFRESINFTFDVTDFTFNEKFRVSKTTVEYLVTKIGHDLEHDTNKSIHTFHGIMESRDREKLKIHIINNNEEEVVEMINKGFDPNYEGGWPIRLAARNGHFSLVKRLIQLGASPHLLSEAGASTLQLAVYSGLHWDTDEWIFLLSCCDSSQLADGAAVAITFNKIAALKKILQTGRCNTNIPTSLTRKTVYDLARGYKLQYLLNTPNETMLPQIIHPTQENNRLNRSREIQRSTHPSQPVHRNLSPSVARFFDLTARQPSLTPPHSPISPIASMFSSQAHQ